MNELTGLLLVFFGPLVPIGAGCFLWRKQPKLRVCLYVLAVAWVLAGPRVVVPVIQDGLLPLWSRYRVQLKVQGPITLAVVFGIMMILTKFREETLRALAPLALTLGLSLAALTFFIPLFRTNTLTPEEWKQTLNILIVTVLGLYPSLRWLVPLSWAALPLLVLGMILVALNSVGVGVIIFNVAAFWWPRHRRWAPYTRPRWLPRIHPRPVAPGNTTPGEIHG